MHLTRRHGGRQTRKGWNISRRGKKGEPSAAAAVSEKEGQDLEREKKEVQIQICLLVELRVVDSSVQGAVRPLIFQRHSPDRPWSPTHADLRQIRD